MHLYLAVNQTRVRTDLELATSMSALCRRHYGISLDELGWVENDDTVWLSVRRQQAAPRRQPHVEGRAQHRAHRAPRRRAHRREAGLPRAAAARAARHARPLHGARHRPLLERRGDPPRLQAAARDLRDGRPRHVVAPRRRSSSRGAQARIDEAHDTLLDPVRRRAYDLSMFPEDEAPAQSSTVPRPALAAEQLMLQGELAREIGPDTEFTGRAPPQGARVAGHRARRDQLAHEDLAVAPRRARGGDLRRPPRDRVRPRLRHRARQVPSPRSRAGPAHVPAADAREERVVTGRARARGDAASAVELGFAIGAVRRRARCCASTRRARSPASPCGTATTTTSARATSRAASATPTRSCATATPCGTRGATTPSATAASWLHSTCSSAQPRRGALRERARRARSLAVVTYLLAREALSPRRARWSRAGSSRFIPGLVLYGALADDRAALGAARARRVLTSRSAWRAGRRQRRRGRSPASRAARSCSGSPRSSGRRRCSARRSSCSRSRARRSASAARHVWRQRALGLAVACGVALVPVLPWTARNCRVMDGCALVSTNAGWNLAIGSFPRATGRFETLRSDDGCREVTGQVQQDRCWLEYGIANIESAPGRWLALIPAKLAFTFDHESFAVEYLREARPAAWPEERRVAVRGVADRACIASSSPRRRSRSSRSRSGGDKARARRGADGRCSRRSRPRGLRRVRRRHADVLADRARRVRAAVASAAGPPARRIPRCSCACRSSRRRRSRTRSSSARTATTWSRRPVLCLLAAAALRRPQALERHALIEDDATDEQREEGRDGPPLQQPSPLDP